MKKEDVEDAIIWALMIDNMGFSQLRKKAEERLRDKEPKYDLHDDPFLDTLSGLIGRAVYKIKQSGKHPVYTLAPQRNEKDLYKIEKFLEKVSANLKKLERKNIVEILNYVEPTIKNLSQLHQKLLVKRHFDEKNSEKIMHILVTVDDVIAQAVALTKRKEERKLSNLYTSIDYTINREYMDTTYVCGPDFPYKQYS